MPNTTNNKPSSLHYIKLAEAYFPILIEQALKEEKIRYKSLIVKAMNRHPNCKYVKNAIPTSIGSALDVVREFIYEQNLPDITALAINRNGECGKRFIDNFDPIIARQAVYDFDWSKYKVVFNDYIDVAKEASEPPLPTRTEIEAKQLMAAFYRLNKRTYSAHVKSSIAMQAFRAKAIELLMKGLTEEEAFDLAVKETSMGSAS